MGFAENFNAKVENSIVGRYFEIGPRRTTFFTEIRAGLVTFLTLAYILAVNSSIIADSGGICSVNDCTGPDKGSPKCKFDGNQGYTDCLDITKKSLITSTALAGLAGSLLMGVGGNLPLALAPGMGLNAYFTYNVVGYRGSGSVTYKDALTAVFIEGWIFVVLSLCGARQFLIRLLPRTLSLSMSVGIGLFLAIIGLEAGEGLGVVTSDGATLVTLGGCDTDYRVNPYYIPDDTVDTICNATLGPVPNLPPAGSAYQCVGGHKMHSPSMWLGLAGFAIMVILMSRNTKGALIIGVLFTTIIAWIPGHGASYLGKTSDLPGGIGGTGDSRWHYFKKVVAVPSLKNVGVEFDFEGLKSGNVWKALITFLYVDFFDTSGTLFSMANFIGVFIPGFVNEKKDFPRSLYAYCSDGFSIIIGSCVGISPCTVYIESATGIREGGRTGITAITVSFCYFISMWFAPLIASIPVFATGPALILVGSLMMINVVKIQWEDVCQAVPAFLTIIVMPFTYSIAYGVIAGIVAYVLLMGARLGLDYVYKVTGGRIGGKHTYKIDVEAEDGPQGLPPAKNVYETEDSFHHHAHRASAQAQNVAAPDPKVANV